LSAPLILKHQGQELPPRGRIAEAFLILDRKVGHPLHQGFCKQAATEDFGRLEPFVMAGLKTRLYVTR